MSNDRFRKLAVKVNEPDSETGKARLLGGWQWIAASLAVAALGVAFVRVSRAQREGQSSGIDAVFLETDSVAAKKLAAARDLLAAKQWGDGIDLVRQIADQHYERVVGISTGRYVSVQTYCDVLLSGLPQEGLKLYRQRTDPQARRWFEGARQARDEEGLQKILKRAYLSSYGDDALQLLGELAWEEGKLALARRYWEQLLPADSPSGPARLQEVLRYPDPDRSPAQVRAQLILCSLAGGEQERARRELEAYRSLHGDSTGDLAGRSGKLVEILAELASEMQRIPSLAGAELSPTFAGNPQRNLALSDAIDVGSIQWSVPLRAAPLVKTPVVVASSRDRIRGELARGEVILGEPLRGERNFATEVLSCYPVVYGNTVLYCDESAIYARELVSANGGAPAWGEEAVIYRAADLQERAPGEGVRQRAGLPRYTVSIDRGRLYARLGNSGTRAAQPALRGPENVLVCLDLEREGDLAWLLRPDRIEPGATDWAFDGPPLAAGGRVYVALRRSEPQLQLNVACLDAESGDILWNRRVCLGLDALGPEVEELRHQLLTLADERLFYNTNLGAVAALDARDGALQWVASYPRVEIDSRAAFTRRQMHGPNPCAYHDGHVYVAPWDSDSVFSFDAESGVQEWVRELKGNVHQIVGVDAGRLIVAGEMLWGLDPETGRVGWFVGQATPDGITHGRAALAGGLVYWPRREEIQLVDTVTGRIRREIDLKDQHGIPGGGNVTLAEGCLVLAQAERLAVFSEFGSLRRTREDQLSQAPSNPESHLALARVAEALHDWPAALASYEQVWHRGDDERRFLGKTSSELACARRAMIRLQQSDVMSAIAEWQTLLDDDAGDDPAPGRLVAQQRARREIGRLVARADPAVRERFEAAAKEDVSEAAQQQDPHALRRAIARNVHSRAVSRGRLALADLQRAAGQIRDADDLRSKVVRGNAPAEERVLALAGLAQSAEARGHWNAAARIWQTLREMQPHVPSTSGGAEEQIADLVPRRLNAIRDQVPATQAPGAMPLIRRWESAIASGETSLMVEASPAVAALGSILVSGPDLICRSTSDGQERWRSAVAEPVVWAGYSGDLLILGSSASLLGVEPESGAVVWQRRLPVMDHSNRGGMNRTASFHIADDRVYCLASGCGLMSFSTASGEISWWNEDGRIASAQLSWHFGPDWIVTPSRRLDGWRSWKTLEGEPAGSVAWSGAFQETSPAVVGDWLGLSDGLATPRTVRLGGPSPTTAAYQGPLSSGASEAYFVAGPSGLVAVIEGKTLVRVDPSTGKPVWSRRGGFPASGRTQPVVILDDTNVFWLSAGVVRCFALEDGAMLWERHIGPATDDWRADRTGPWLALHPARVNPQSRLTLCDPESGAIVARVPCPGRSGGVRLVAEHERVVLATDTRLAGYRVLTASAD